MEFAKMLRKRVWKMGECVVTVCMLVCMRE